jgi:hypothetical protein
MKDVPGEERFRRLYGATWRPVFAYALRRVAVCSERPVMCALKRAIYNRDPRVTTDIANPRWPQIYRMMQGRSGTHIILPEAGILYSTSREMADLLSFP